MPSTENTHWQNYEITALQTDHNHLHVLRIHLVIRHLRRQRISLYGFFFYCIELYLQYKAGRPRVSLSGIVACIESGQKVLGLWGFRLVEVPHDVSPLLPDMNGFLKLHFPLHAHKRISD